MGAFCVEACSGFVRQHHCRVVDQRPRNGYALLLSTRHLRWQIVEPVRKAEASEQVAAARAAGGV